MLRIPKSKNAPRYPDLLCALECAQVESVQKFSIKFNDIEGLMAEREGFEPSIRLPVYTRSRRAPSTTRPPLQMLGILMRALRSSSRSRWPCQAIICGFYHKSTNLLAKVLMNDPVSTALPASLVCNFLHNWSRIPYRTRKSAMKQHPSDSQCVRLDP